MQARLARRRLLPVTGSLLQFPENSKRETRQHLIQRSKRCCMETPEPAAGALQTVLECFCRTMLCSLQLAQRVKVALDRQAPAALGLQAGLTTHSWTPNNNRGLSTCIPRSGQQALGHDLTSNAATSNGCGCPLPLN